VNSYGCDYTAIHPSVVAILIASIFFLSFFVFFCHAQQKETTGGYNYRDMRPLLYRILILLAVIGLIAAPMLLTANAELRRAESALAAGRPLDAVADFEHVARLLFWRDGLWERSGRAAFAGGDMAESIRLLKQAPALSVEGWAELGAAYYQLGQFDESVCAFQRGLELHGPAASLYRGLVLAFNAQGDLQAETSALQNYITLEDGEAPQSP
jgi:tetratricopeptide (TPR) repeat protein